MMSKYDMGDKVRFRGDNVTYTVSLVNDDGSLDLREGGANFRSELQYIPDRLLEPAPPEVKPGQVWKHKVTGARLLVMKPAETNPPLHRVASEVSSAASYFSTEHLAAHYELEHNV